MFGGLSVAIAKKARPRTRSFNSTGLSVGKRPAKKVTPAGPAPQTSGIRRPGRPGQSSATPTRPTAAALANAGQRSKLPDSALPPNLLRQRQLNRRLAQPITPGSGITERALARQVNAALAAQFGPQVQQAQTGITQAAQHTQNVGSYYDQYLRELAAHQQNVTQYQAGAQAAMASLGQAAGGLNNQTANLSSEAPVSAENQQIAQQAGAVRQAGAQTFGATQAGIGAAENTYADTLARVVGPQQKLQALQQAGVGQKEAAQALSTVLSQKGQAKTTLTENARSGEAKNVLAQSIASGKETGAAATRAETRRSHKAGEALRNKSIDESSKQAAARAAAEAGKTNKWGYTNAQWQAMTTQRRRSIMRRTAAQNKATADKTKPPRTGVGSLKPEAEKAQATDINRLANAIKSGIIVTRDDPSGKKDDQGRPKQVQVKLSHSEIRQQIAQGIGPFGKMDPAAVNLAFVVASGQGLSAYDVQQAHKLGLHTGGRWKIRATFKPTQREVAHGG